MLKKVFYTVLLGIMFLISIGLQAQVYYNGCTATSTKQASAIGLNCSSTGNQSFASGNYALATGNNTTALGSFVQATATNAFTFGTGVSTSGYLTNSTANSFLFGFSNNPVLFAQFLSTSNEPRVGIGTRTPLHTLDVNGDVMLNNLCFAGTEMKIRKHITGPLPISESGQEDPEQGRGGVDIITIKSNGAVGINNNNPTAGLHVNGTLKSDILEVDYSGKMKNLELTGKPLPNGGILNPLHYLKIGNLWNFYYDGFNYKIGRNSLNGYYINNSPASCIYFTDGGSVIIGSASSGNIGSAINYSSSLGIDNNDIRVSTQLFYVEANSYFSKNVGIKESNPQYPLHVTGVSYLNGNTHITGNVGIGSAPSSTYKLAINGKIGCKEIVVTNSGWADYVFEPDYALMPLGELESFISENKRLPDVPSASHVEENGVELATMNVLLLKKVEELTLYILDLQKQIDELKK